ncbi:Epididymal secretory protein E1 [Orchesella cincta]|uniref:Epididymal secretory protein E1 n=1 Tax=Orchesella cincta TaxID=48709 RepID=A0A1D2NFQ8_ORCCI|nr:Epididymal secretory protein E1 [Orchesella cincta]
MKSLQIAVACCLLAILTVVAGQRNTPITVRNCRGETPKASLTSVFIENCTQEPCIFRKGQNYSIEMDLEILGPVESMEAHLYAKLAGISFNWGGNPEACNDIISAGPRCPLKTGDNITYGGHLYVSEHIATFTADFKYIVLDENRETLVCWLVKASVQEARN